ncbi:hypothetical protein CPB83DRAFT_651350 [Crepidotus variabilis]|uniref:Uncharacterized protein n=1 Tax=Crepidotus variabilis TaxID=179855 RepID=A0A9P6E731_9AGAR|nr:hypothetical protein CPB83DRAFT_651350 [Crepidotus variabilis]
MSSQYDIIFEVSRYSPMDAQRFDPSKRQKSLSSSFGDSIDEQISEELRSHSPASSATNSTSSSWEDRVIAILASPISATHYRKAKKSNSSNSLTSQSSHNSQTSPTSLVVASTTFPAKNETHCTDVFEHEDSTTTTRTIIRPTRSRSTLFCLSPKASIDNLTSTRSSSPLGLNKLEGLNCLGGQSGNFEDAVDMIQQEREKKLTGVQDTMRVCVYQEQTVVREESWRETVGAMLYEKPRVMNSVVGRVEVC